MLQTYLLPGGWVIKCHFLEQNGAGLSNAGSKGFAPSAGPSLLLPDTAAYRRQEDTLSQAEWVQPHHSICVWPAASWGQCPVLEWVASEQQMS